MLNTSRYIIYGLVDPRTKLLRYVGQSSRGMIRPKQRHVGHCWSWEENLINEGLKPEIAVIEELEVIGSLNDSERFWISYFRALGANLTNLTDGGEGVKGWVPSDEWREKQSKVTVFRNPINLGRKQPEEEKIRRANSCRGQKRSLDTKMRMSQVRMGMKFSDEHRKHIGDAARNRVVKEETRRKLSQAAKLAWERKREHTS